MTAFAAARPHIQQRLEVRYPQLAPGRISLAAESAAARLADARIVQYVPILVERIAREILDKEPARPTESTKA